MSTNAIAVDAAETRISGAGSSCIKRDRSNDFAGSGPEIDERRHHGKLKPSDHGGQQSRGSVPQRDLRAFRTAHVDTRLLLRNQKQRADQHAMEAVAIIKAVGVVAGISFVSAPAMPLQAECFSVKISFMQPAIAGEQNDRVCPSFD
jgi:hypothetical protein